MYSIAQKINLFLRYMCRTPSCEERMQVKVKGGNYSHAKFRNTLVIVRRHRPYAIGEDPELLEIFRHAVYYCLGSVCSDDISRRAGGIYCDEDSRCANASGMF